MMSNNNNPELKTWFDDALKQGHTIDELIPHLKEHGYTNEMIDPVVSQLKAELDQNTIVEEIQSPESDNSNESDALQSETIEQEENQESSENINVIENVEDDLDTNTESQESNENINVIENVEDDLDTIEDEHQEEEQEDNQDSGELTLEEIEAELEAQSQEIDQKKTKNLMKPLISIVILIAVLIGGYVAYPKVLDIINNFTQSSPKAAPPTLPGNTFDTPASNTDFTEEENQISTSLEDQKVETNSSEQKLRKFKKELYFQ